jgi:anion-transporting  ArsA/GET3 family ATPase
MNHARLHVFTGKGGVGKTAFALAYSLALKNRGQKVLYNSFDQLQHHGLCDALGIEELKLDVETSALTYMEKKLGSKLIAGWIAKTPFFKALYDMLPSFSQMILFGHLVEKLKNDPELTIVIDSPSSGHALTLFESSLNFREMFKTGLIVNDINQMLDFIIEQKQLETTVIVLPTLMALQEGIELRDRLKAMQMGRASLWLNDSLCFNQDLVGHPNELPDFLKTKIENENQVLNSYRDELGKVFPRYATLKLRDTVIALEKKLQESIS